MNRRSSYETSSYRDAAEKLRTCQSECADPIIPRERVNVVGSYIRSCVATLLRGGAAFALAFFAIVATADETSFPASFKPFAFSFSRIGAEYRIGAGTGYTFYYIAFERTADLRQPFATVALALGSPAPLFGYTPALGELQGFFHLAAIDVFSPRDSDGDGMDDLWELTQNLDAMNPDDASLPSAFDPGKSNLAYYRNRFGLEPVTGFYSRETTVFNAPAVVSREASVFNFPNLTGASVEGISREVSVFNFPASGASAEAISREVSVLKP